MLELDHILTTLLYQRGIHSPEEVAHFLKDTYPNGLHDPFLMRGMLEASKRVAHAISEGESITVYGDYDTDGITATTLLSQAISAMGGVVQPYIPHREREGYGLNHEAIDYLSTEGVQLLITVDCGISNAKEVAYAQSLGIDVIVTDHHTPPEELPQALAIVNPKQPGCAYPYKQLVGVAIAFKLVWALLKQGLRSSQRGRDMLELVALGSIADIAPLNGENRVLVKAGLEAINITQRPGLQALIRASGIKSGNVDSMGVGFRLAPRLNAAGRLDDARDSYYLLLSQDRETAEQLADQLNQKNRLRQQMTEQFHQVAQSQAETAGKHHQPVIVIAGESYMPGLVGLVASRLVGAWNRPVILLAQDGEFATGSARSIAGFNIIEALTHCKELFERFGGHSMAAGLTIKTERIPELEARLIALANEQITPDMLVPTLNINACVDLKEVTWDLYQQLEQLEPFGPENPQPILMSRNVQATDIRTIGGNNQHLKLRLSSNGERPHEAIAFRLGHLAEPLQRYPKIDIAYTLDIHEWNEQRFLQLNIKDFRKSS